MLPFLEAKDFFDPGVVPMCTFRLTHTKRPLHAHDFFEIMLLVRGVARHHLEDADTQEIRAGDVFLIHPGRAHSYESLDGEPLEVVNILFQLDPMQMNFRDLSQLPGFQTLFSAHASHRNLPHVRLAAADFLHVSSVVRAIELEMEEQALGYEFLIETKLRELICLFSRKYSSVLQPQDKNFLKISSVVGFMDQHFKDDIQFEDLIEHTKMSATALRLAFQNSLACSPMGYLQQVRIREASLLLMDSELSITDVALAVGFNDSSYFTRVFKQEYGETPTAYRMQL